MKNYAEQQVRPSTLSQYQYLFKLHIIPALGQVEVAKLGVEAIQSLKADKLRSGLAPQTVKHMTRLIRQMLNHAIDWGYIRKNPAQKVQDPKIPKREMDCFTPEEVRVLLNQVPAKWFPFFLIAVTTGLRSGELLAMKWQNLDKQNNQYVVKETLTRKRELQEVGFAEVKTQGSAQPVDVTPMCLKALETHKQNQAEEKLKAGASYTDYDLIFSTAKGTPLDAKNVVNRVFHPTLAEAGLKRIRFHDLRHTTASIMIAQGENPKYIQKQMRHASIEITFDRYGHLFPDTNREAAQRLDETLLGGQGLTAVSA